MSKIVFVKPVVDEKDEEEVMVNTEFIKSFINTKTHKKINFEDLLTYTTTKFITDKSDIIVKHINKLVSIVNETFYIYSEDIRIHYKLPPSMITDDFLKVFIITFVESSIKKLSHSEQDKLGKNISLTADVLKTIKTNLRVHDKTFSDPKLGEIHFRNGYLNLRTMEFKQRKRTDFMTYCIQRDFSISSQKSKETVHAIINQIYTNENDKHCILESFGEGLTGESNKSQYNLFLLGAGQSGKSTIMKMSKISFKEMVFEFKEDTFAIGNQKADRVLNMLMHNPYIRIMWVNELKGKIDDSLFKQVCEGLVNTTTLFKEGQNTVEFNALLVNTMNEFPNIKIDSGVARRIKSLEHQSYFTTDKSAVNPSKRIFEVNRDLEEMFKKSEDLQNAFVEIIAEYAHEFLKGKRYPLSDNFKETKISIVDTNDLVKGFIESHLIKTNEEKDKIHPEELFESFKMINPSSKITKQQLIGSFKDKGIIFNHNVRSNIDSNKRGCFIYIKFKEIGNDNDVKYEFGKSEENNALKDENKALKDENEALKKDIEELKKQLELLKNPKPVEPVKEEIKVLPKKKTISLEELEAKTEDKPKIKKNKSKVKQIDSSDIDDGYDTDELELEFSGMIKNLKKI
jgi:hypothetical protein